MDELCKQCKKPIPEERQKHHAKYCSEECSQVAERQKYRRSNPNIPSLATGTVGAVSELRVAADFPGPCEV